jgi:hypothetical protein
MDVIQLFLNYICLYNMYALWYKLSIIFILKFINVIQYRDDIMVLVYFDLRFGGALLTTIPRIRLTRKHFNKFPKNL